VVQLVSNARADLSETGFLIAESNHRIANNLTVIAGLLRLQAADIVREGNALSPQDIRLLLEEVGGRIETVGRLHRLFADTAHGGPLDLRQYLQEIADAAIGSMSFAGDMTLGTPLSGPCLIPAHQALSVGFIVGELVTNAVKYAHPAGVKGRIELGCDPRPQGAILIRVADDGVGLPEGFDPKQEGGLGMRMVRSLAEQLNASLIFDSSPIGLAVRLLIPQASGPKLADAPSRTAALELASSKSGPTA
jgi:two-component sensor histidine kinase